MHIHWDAAACFASDPLFYKCPWQTKNGDHLKFLYFLPGAATLTNFEFFDQLRKTAYTICAKVHKYYRAQLCQMSSSKCTSCISILNKMFHCSCRQNILFDIRCSNYILNSTLENNFLLWCLYFGSNPKLDIDSITSILDENWERW